MSRAETLAVDHQTNKVDCHSNFTPVVPNPIGLAIEIGPANAKLLACSWHLIPLK